MTIFHVPDNKKREVWNHFIERWAVEKLGGGHGVTGPRLKYIKPIIWRDYDFWFDIVHRHGMQCKTPFDLMCDSEERYDHCLGNFWGMIYQSLMRHGKVKP